MDSNEKQVSITLKEQEIFDLIKVLDETTYQMEIKKGDLCFKDKYYLEYKRLLRKLKYLNTGYFGLEDYLKNWEEK